MEFITNEKRLLSEIIGNALTNGADFDALVGYFYFSGFEQLCDSLADKKLRILVGLEVEKRINNAICEYESFSLYKKSRSLMQSEYYDSLVSIYNDTPFFDNPEKQAAFRLFLEKINDGSLEIRKTSEPNHAKLYIFTNKSKFSHNGDFPGTVITGSSNLTQSGLGGQFEINVISREKSDYQEAFGIFERLWKDSIIIVDSQTLDLFKERVIKKIWLDKLYSPFLMFVRVLDEYFKQDSNPIKMPSQITEQHYLDFTYQTDAIQKAIKVIDSHNGVIISDVVGLGKSIIASAVAHNLGMRTIIIAPPHLESQWKDYSHQFNFVSSFYSSGKIEQALENHGSCKGQLIIIDEAHKYRNPITADYANLHRLCQGNKVVLLSATPFNNSPEDIFAMVSLFQIPAKSTIRTVGNLSARFRFLIKQYNKLRNDNKNEKITKEQLKAGIRLIADEIRDMLTPIVIRRSRKDLEMISDYREDLAKQNISFPKVNDPIDAKYQLGSIEQTYIETLDKILPEEDKDRKRQHKQGFIGARYMPINYVKNRKAYIERMSEELGVDKNLLEQAQLNAAAFMRHLLVQRFESSIYAFTKTLKSIINSCENIKKWYEEAGKVPIHKKVILKDFESYIEEDSDDKTLDVNKIESLQDKGVWFIEKKELSVEFGKELDKDIALLKELLCIWEADNIPDPKLEHFAEILKESFVKEPKRKIVVFSQAADTANYLYKRLTNDHKLKAFLYTGAIASDANRRIINDNFDANSNKQADDHDILIATDSISEGFNLHRAGTIFNYDIPYNPTRVVQRVGRINRINKKVFDELYIYNYFPTTTGEREIGSKRISTLKIALFHAIFGDDTKVLTAEEELDTFLSRQFVEAAQEDEHLSPEAKYEDFIRKLRKYEPEVIEKAAEIPHRARICRSAQKNEYGVLVFGKKGREYSFRLSDGVQTQTLTAAKALGLFEAQTSEKAEKVSDNFYQAYKGASERLFDGQKKAAMDKGKRETIDKLKTMITQYPQHQDYLKDALIVVDKLDSMPERYCRQIRRIKLNNIDKEMKELQKDMPREYMAQMFKTAEAVEAGEETLILAEEFNG